MEKVTVVIMHCIKHMRHGMIKAGMGGAMLLLCTYTVHKYMEHYLKVLNRVLTTLQ